MAKTKLTAGKTINYKGHTIRVCADVQLDWREYVLIDNDANEIEDAPIYMQDNEFDYGSVADAKRMINGQFPKFYPAVLDDVPQLKERFFARFK